MITIALETILMFYDGVTPLMEEAFEPVEDGKPGETRKVLRPVTVKSILIEAAGYRDPNADQLTQMARCDLGHRLYKSTEIELDAEEVVMLSWLVNATQKNPLAATQVYDILEGRPSRLVIEE